MKKLAVFLLIAISSFSFLSAAVKLAEESLLLYFPTTVVDNANVLVNLGTPGSLSAGDFQATFTNTSDGNLALFRIRETLCSNPGTTTVSTENGTIAITIESLDNWTFVNENNPTQTCPFTLDAFYVEERWKGKGSSGSSTFDATTGQIGTSTALTYSGKTASFVISNGVYTLTLPYTYYSKGQQRYYPYYPRTSDICLNIPALDSAPEPGYYSTRLVITIPAYTKYDENKTSSLVGEQTITITVRGYLGIDAADLAASSSFAVLSSSDTYSMNLGISANPGGGYSVARTTFNYSNVIYDTQPSGANQTTAKYTIYVSPTRDYSDTSSAYRFIKIGSENQARTDENTIYYELTWDGKTSNISYIRPTYTSTQLSSTANGGNAGRNSWLVSWTLDKTIYLNLTDASLDTAAEHQQGLYYSYAYFTLVTN